MKNRRRETKHGETHMFAGLVKCEGCGSALNVSYDARKGKFTGFSCWVYKNYGKDRCTSHAIGYKTLYNIVLNDIRKKAEFVTTQKSRYLALLESKMEENIQQDVKKLQGELKRITNRKNQIDKISQKLYEDRALEKIPEDRYLSLSTVYDEEQSQLTSRKEEIESLLTEIETNKENIQFFTQLIEKYSDIQELNARILNELIEKIVVSEKEIINGEKYQCVHIYYKFVGLISI